jgi:hypothetical protein
MPDEMLMKITAFLLQIKDGSTVGQLKKEHPRGYRYINIFDVINLVVGDKPILVYRQKPDESGTLPPLNQCFRVSCCSTCFVDIRAVHIASGTHMKGNKLLNAVKAKFGASIPRWACEMFTATCPSCIRGSIRITHKAGHQPIITLGFGSRGQLDLIDMQSMPDGAFKWIMNYTDHGIKLTKFFSLCSKECRGVAWLLYQLFCFIGPPSILQTDNGGEFNGIALDGKARKEQLSDEVRTHALFTYYFIFICHLTSCQYSGWMVLSFTYGCFGQHVIWFMVNHAIQNQMEELREATEPLRISLVSG